MKTKEIAELYADAIGRWGEDSQIVLAIEELAELTKELTKFLRGDGSISKLAEEVADVEIMLEQLRSMFPGVADEADSWREKKLVRLKKRLEEV